MEQISLGLELHSHSGDNFKLSLPQSWRLESKWVTVVEEILERVESDLKIAPICPRPEHIFRALDGLKPDQVKVIVLGQDPYHGRGQAIGRAFAVSEHQPQPPSLRNLEKELRANACGKGIGPKPLKDLNHWEAQGVLLLNTILTVRENEPLSHRSLGWEAFTVPLIAKLLAPDSTPKVALLLGAAAQGYQNLALHTHHKVVSAPHPSPLSAYRGFFGSKIFDKVNEALISQGSEAIRW